VVGRLPVAVLLVLPVQLKVLEVAVLLPEAAAEAITTLPEAQEDLEITPLEAAEEPETQAQEFLPLAEVHYFLQAGLLLEQETSAGAAALGILETELACLQVQMEALAV
jgi:hypothetical protein